MNSRNIKKIPSSHPITQANVANVLHEYIEGYLNEIFAMSDNQRLYDVYEIDESSDDGRVMCTSRCRVAFMSDRLSR
jgi:hypothetical protein